jgi:acyl-CoA reductase-like NAD-dependent aldehyde dehydrogenase
VGAGEVGAALLEQPVDGVFFTGSHATGQRIAEAVGQALRQAAAGAGRQGPDLRLRGRRPEGGAESLADGAMYNTGPELLLGRAHLRAREDPRRLRRAFVARSGHEEGDPMSEDTYIGAITRAPQLDVLERRWPMRWPRARRCCMGGEAPARPGNWFEPTVLSNVTTRWSDARGELRPVIGIQKVAATRKPCA